MEFLARELVDDPDSVSVTESQDQRGTLITVRVAPDDMGKVIGRGGRTAEDDEDGREVRVRASRPNGGRMLVAFEGVGDRNAAELLRGLTLVVPRSSLPELPPGEFWPHQLEGCIVVTESGRTLGAITDVVANPAQDLWVTVDEAGAEIMVPAIREVVVDVDVAAGRVLVRDIPGLTAPDDQP